MILADHPGPSIVLVTSPQWLLQDVRDLPHTLRQRQIRDIELSLRQFAGSAFGAELRRARILRIPMVPDAQNNRLEGAQPDVTVIFTIPRRYANCEQNLMELVTGIARSLIAREQMEQNPVTLPTAAFYLVFDDGGYVGAGFDRGGNTTPVL